MGVQIAFVPSFLLSACQAEVATGRGAVAPRAKQAAVVIDTLKISTWLSPAGVGDPAWGRAELLPPQPLRLPDVCRAGHAAHAPRDLALCLGVSVAGLLLWLHMAW